MIIRGGIIVTSDGNAPARGDVLVRNGVIAAITGPGVLPREGDELDAEGQVVMPGMVDPHVHFGIAAPVGDDFLSESRSAARGGVTTVLSFNKTMGSYHDVLPGWIAEASSVSHVDFGFHLGVFTKEHVEELPDYISRYGVNSFKFFMSYRGVERSKFGLDVALDDAFLFGLMEVLGRLPSRPRLCVHCENMELVRHATSQLGRQVSDLSDWHTVRTGWSEADAMQRTLLYAEATGAQVYIVHVSARETAARLERASLGMPDGQVVFETCPHYLTLTVDEAQPRVGSLAKVNPPIRTSDDATALWAAIRHGSISTVGSDHVPRPLQTKLGDGSFAGATAGFPGLEVTLPLLMTYGAAHGVGLQDIALLTATHPAACFGLGSVKGRIAVGFDADFVIVDVETEREVRASGLESSSGYSPYEGMRLRGWPVATVLRGAVVMRNGSIAEGGCGGGRYLKTCPVVVP